MPSKRRAPSSFEALDSDAGDSFSPSFRAPLSSRRTPRPPHRPPYGSSLRKSDPRRRSRSRALPDSTTLARALLPLASSSSLHGGKMWNDEDEIVLLNAAAAFRSRQGAPPRLPDMAVLYDAIRDSIAPHLDQPKVYYKLKRIKSKFMHAALGENVTAHERRIRDLCGKVWPEDFVGVASENGAPDVTDNEEMMEGGGGKSVDFPALKEAMAELWNAKYSGISTASLEKGLKGIDEEDRRALEVKWRKQIEAESRSKMRKHELVAEVYGMMIEATRRLGPPN